MKQVNNFRYVALQALAEDSDRDSDGDEFHSLSGGQENLGSLIVVYTRWFSTDYYDFCYMLSGGGEEEEDNSAQGEALAVHIRSGGLACPLSRLSMGLVSASAMKMKIVMLIALTSEILVAIASTEPVSSMSIHTVFSVECSSYLDWQSVALAASHQRVGQPGPLTVWLRQVAK